MLTMRGTRITLLLFNIAMKNDPFIDEFPMTTMKTSIYSGFSMAMLNNQMVRILWWLASDKTLLVSSGFIWSQNSWYARMIASWRKRNPCTATCSFGVSCVGVCCNPIAGLSWLAGCWQHSSDLQSGRVSLSSSIWPRDRQGLSDPSSAKEQSMTAHFWILDMSLIFSYMFWICHYSLISIGIHWYPHPGSEMASLKSSDLPQDTSSLDVLALFTCSRATYRRGFARRMRREKPSAPYQAGIQTLETLLLFVFASKTKSPHVNRIIISHHTSSQKKLTNRL